MSAKYNEKEVFGKMNKMWYNDTKEYYMKVKMKEL